jgi:single-stranded-DNA-specific exonuclease
VRFSIECVREIGYKPRLMEKRWHILTPEPAVVSALRESLGCHPVVATLLANRRLESPEQAQSFLNASLSQLRPPTGLKDLAPAVERMARAVTSGESILLFGDYDVDGTTATAVLFEFLRACGASVTYYIPHRLKEGYGLQARHISEVAVPRRAALLITVDCGSGSYAAVEAARTAGVDVIITDHHTIGEQLPKALAVINPKRKDCTAGLDRLAGVGVAFCLALALRKHLRDLGFWKDRAEPNMRSLCDMVALGTIADMVPLLEENRILAKAGLELIGSGRRPGLVALMDAAGISNRPADSEDVAFRLGPRLNAAGRVDHAGLAVDLLTTDRLDTARQIAQTLNALNANRQDIERGILADIQTVISRQPELLKRRTLVLAHAGWHEGVLGIVASKVMDRYYRPVVLIGLSGGSGRGSARCIPGIDLYACLSACQAHLEELGGHMQAAGLKISEAQLPAFRQAFEEAVRQATGPDLFTPTLAIDAELDLGEISEDLVDQLETLMPFGTGNPEPLFMARDVLVVSSSRVGQHHRRLMLRQASGPAHQALRAIHFHVDAPSASQDRFERLVFKLRWNRWNGNRTIQLVIEEAFCR